MLFNIVSIVVFDSIMPYRNAHEMWTKLQDKYDVSKIYEDDCFPSTSGRDEYECSSSTTSPTCELSQGNDMVSGGGNCNGDIEPSIDDTSSLSHCNVSSLDISTCGTKNTIHACVDSPCISSRNCLNKSCDDMLAMSCCHNTNASISSSLCDANIIEETEDTLGQDKVLNGASRNSSSSPSLDSYICLMARASKVTRSLEPNISCDDEDDDSEEDNDDDIASLNEKGKMIFHALRKNKNACSNFVEI